MVLDHFPALEADFCRFYRIDLPVALWGPEPMSARRFTALVAGLPPEAKLVRDLTPPDPHPGWGNTEELLAALIETTDVTNRTLFAAHSKQGTRQPDPIRVPRPWEKKPSKPRQASPAEIATFFGGDR